MAVTNELLAQAFSDVVLAVTSAMALAVQILAVASSGEISVCCGLAARKCPWFLRFPR